MLKIGPLRTSAPHPIGLPSSARSPALVRIWSHLIPVLLSFKAPPLGDGLLGLSPRAPTVISPCMPPRTRARQAGQELRMSTRALSFQGFSFVRRHMANPPFRSLERPLWRPEAKRRRASTVPLIVQKANWTSAAESTPRGLSVPLKRRRELVVRGVGDELAWRTRAGPRRTPTNSRLRGASPCPASEAGLVVRGVG